MGTRLPYVILMFCLFVPAALPGQPQSSQATQPHASPEQAEPEQAEPEQAEPEQVKSVAVSVPAQPTFTLPPAQRPTPADVMLDGRPLFPITAAIGPFSPGDRAAAASHKLAQFAADSSATPQSIRAVDGIASTDVIAGDTVLTTVMDTDSDFDRTGRSRQALAADHARQMRAAVAQLRDEHSYRSLSIGALKAAIATLILLALLFGLHLLFPAMYRALERRRGTHIRTIRIQSLEVLSEERILEILQQSLSLLRFAVTALLLYFYIPLVFSFFPQTRSFGRTLIGYVLAPIVSGWLGLLAYLPRLLVVLVVVFFAFQARKLTRFLFKEVERGTIVWPGFYPEWAMPTHRIVEILIVAFALVVVFPYLPGSSSAAFRGVSIFLGVLFSLGSSSAIANVVAGVLLTYTRAFRVGDRVQIADSVGDVLEKTLLATHIRTIKNVDVTVPNALVLGSHIVNFSRSSELHPLILNAKLTLGYDVAWSQVHSLLIAAAGATEGVLAEPKPFVLQTSLDDFYVSYEINAYTADPAGMATIYSELYRHILDAFNEAGVEIMSPHYNALRQGEATTLPESYLAPDEPRSTARHPHRKE